MKRIIVTIFIPSLAVVLSSCATRNNSQPRGSTASYYTRPPGPMSDEVAGSVWPHVVVSGSTTNIIYEPQVDSWDGRQFTGSTAVGLQSPGEPQPIYGVVTFHGISLVDKTKRTVALADLRVLGDDFPSARQKNQDYLKLLSQSFPRQLEGLSLDRLETSFVTEPQQLKGSFQALNNSPPKIIFSTSPAILVSIDGPPVFRPVSGTTLQRVINTRLLLLRNKAGQLYLRLWDGYMTSSNLDGTWRVAKKPPKGAAEAELQAMSSPTPVDLWEGQAGALPNNPPSLTSASAPVIYVATKPTELILCDGRPNFLPIEGTHLLYVANTSGNVFKLLTDQQTYVLISGRGFRAASLDGPWQFVPADRLAPDFANIPDTSPKENVKASVPGTQQAAEALIANSIPESAAIARNTQMLNPQIDGPPSLQPITGTPLYYVVNSGTPILKVNEQSWLACQNGVWYAAASVHGPWTVANAVPSVIYSIPPASPLHYLTYVQVYGATPESVYEGYTPGYLGTEVEDGAVVYGTGYDYPPWIGDEWYGWPCTWGFGWNPCWTPWDDWCFDSGFGWGCGAGRFGWRHFHPPMPGGGPNRGWHHEGGIAAWGRNDTGNTAGNLYARQGLGGAAGTHPMSGAAALAGYARAYNSRTGAEAAGQGATVPNVANRAFDARNGNWEVNSLAPNGAWRMGSSFASRYGPKSPSSELGRAHYARGFGAPRSLGAGPWHGSSGRGGFFHGGWGGGGGRGGGGGGGHSGGGSGGGHGGGGGGHR